MIQEEENLKRACRTIPPGACPDTAPHLEEFDRSYIREYSEDVVIKHPIDTCSSRAQLCGKAEDGGGST